MKKKLLSILSYVFAVYVGGLLVSSTIAQRSPAGGGKRALSAAANQTLLDVMSAEGLWRFPPFASDPSACGAAQQGVSYFNTTDDEFKVCDGTGPTYVNSGVTTTQLNDLSDVLITAPANDEILRFVTGTSDWRNAAQTASAISALSDVDTTGAVNTDVLQFNGSTWVDAAVSASSLSGLSDVTLGTPAEGERLVFGTTDWNDTDVSADYFMFPGNFAIGNWTVASAAVINADDQVKLFRVHFQQPITVDRIVWAVMTQTGTGCDNGGVGLYTIDGLTLLVSVTTIYDTNNVIKNVDATNTFVEAGDYWLAYTADESTTCTVRTVTDPAGTTIDYDTIANTGNTIMGTAANPSVSGVFPATTGTITANDNVDRPVIKLIGT